jgi:hypothetical protein
MQKFRHFCSAMAVRLLELEFVLHDESFPVEKLVIRQTCDALDHEPQVRQRHVQSDVTADVLQLFISGVQDGMIKLMKKNIGAFKSTPAHRIAPLEDRLAKPEAETNGPSGSCDCSAAVRREHAQQWDGFTSTLPALGGKRTEQRDCDTGTAVIQYGNADIRTNSMSK